MALMRYYAQYNDSGKLLAIGTGHGGTEITESEYNTLLSEIREKAALVADFDQIFGLKLDEPREEYAKKGANDGVDVEKIEALIAARKEARAAKNWAESDRIRDELAAMNVVIKDSKEGTTWEIKG